jgi:two-component system, OmpR family, response regulator
MGGIHKSPGIPKKTLPDHLGVHQLTTILCVDDNADLVELLSELLKMRGYETRTASGGEECLLMLNEEGFHPDLVLLDIMMEPMDGWETLLHIRDHPVHRDVPVIMVTGKYPTLGEVETYGPMIDDYLMKPYHPHEIDELIRYILKRASRVQETVRIARERGVDEAVIAEYQHLVPLVEVMKRFRQIISSNEHFNNEILVKAESRFAAIKGQLATAGGRCEP